MMTCVPIHGMAFHIQEGFSYMGMLPICRKTAHVWKAFSYMRRPPIYKATLHIYWEGFPYVGRPKCYCYLYRSVRLGDCTEHAICEDFPNMRGLPYMGSLPIHGKASHTHICMCIYIYMYVYIHIAIHIYVQRNKSCGPSTSGT